MKKVLIGAAIALGGAAIAFAGMVGYVAHAFRHLDLNDLHREEIK